MKQLLRRLKSLLATAPGIQGLIIKLLKWILILLRALLLAAEIFLDEDDFPFGHLLNLLLDFIEQLIDELDDENDHQN